jgi:hypothetical protein
MTTSWALATRGQLWEAGLANWGGLMLSIIALAYIPASCYFFFGGHCTRGRWFSNTLAVALVLTMTMTVVQWLARLAA